MEGLVEFSIPIKGLRQGVYEFRFRVDRSFFTHFEGSPLAEGQVDVALNFDKRSDLFVLEFELAGTVRTECDRCLAPIDLPIADRQRLLVKISEAEEVEEADVVYLHPEATQLNVATYIYEFIVLSMPIIKVYDCESEEPRPCNEEMLRYLRNGEHREEESKPEINPIWDELRNSLNDN